MKKEEFEWIIQENADRIALEIITIPDGWYREVYYDPEKDKMSFSTVISRAGNRK